MRRRKLLSVAPAVAAGATLCVTAAAYACTTFIGTFTVSGSHAGTVTATGTGAMTQTVSGSWGAASTKTQVATAVVKVSTGANGSQVLPQGTYDINFYNSGPSGSLPGYSDHSTWNTDCMDSSGVPLAGTKLGSVTVGSAGTITAASGGTLSGGTVTFSNGPAPNLDGSPTESAVCISDSSGTNGNEAPIAVLST